jgi:hypothetical protein
MVESHHHQRILSAFMVIAMLVALPRTKPDWSPLCLLPQPPSPSTAPTAITLLQRMITNVFAPFRRPSRQRGSRPPWPSSASGQKENFNPTQRGGYSRFSGSDPTAWRPQGCFRYFLQRGKRSNKPKLEIFEWRRLSRLWIQQRRI